MMVSAEAIAEEVGRGMVVHSQEAELKCITRRKAAQVPVVFVHGMLGSPVNWSAMIEQLNGDPSLRARFQFLTFGYDSLQPIHDSGRELLETLDEARRQFDPEGTDRSFDQIVLVGHSLGGIVAKDAVALANGPQLANLALSHPHGNERVHIGRVIFVATPHRGATINRGVVNSFGSVLARSLSPSIVANKDAGGIVADQCQTSVDQLTWDNPLLTALEQARAATAVPFHSIIASLRENPLDGPTDGIVPVASARLAGARSELVVRAPHICFQNAAVIGEVRRILHEHAAQAVRPSAPAPGVAGAARPLEPVPASGSLATTIGKPDSGGQETDSRMTREAHR
jgi:pimeloyl-ACP methyl ester carboxylesterase